MPPSLRGGASGIRRRRARLYFFALAQQYGVFMMRVFQHLGLRLCTAIALMLLTILPAANLRADQLQMNDGTVLEGTILSQGDKYWVKSADGTSKIVPASDVKKY